MLFSELGLHERLLKALDHLDLREPTPVQAAVIPSALEGRDIQASAETGSGKTAAFLLPVLQRLIEQPAPDTATRCLILLPTRELATQIHRHFQVLARFTHVKAGLLLGGGDFKAQKAMVRKNPDILIGTPGRVKEHVDSKSVDLSDLEVLILDEADRMLDMGFREDVMSVVRACRRERQSMLLSATLRHEGIGRIAGEVLREPVVVALGERGEQHADIAQRIILADDNGHKRQLLTWLLANEKYEKALVFCNTRDSVVEVAEFLRAHKRKSAALHGELLQDERNRVMGLFRSGGVDVLVATDLAARGLDVAGMDLVINFALARSGDEYVHRVGRTGRAGRQGLAVSLISHQEWNRLCAIERYLGLRFERAAIEGLVARFKEPEGRTGRKKDTKKSAKKKAAPAKHVVPKAKQRLRNRKNVGKRRKPVSEEAAKSLGQGFAPLKRKKEP